MNIEDRKTEQYRKNNDLEGLLKEINDIVATDYPSERELNYPILFVVGTPRSGTTLLTQWLASLDLFCYPTNFVSRFYSNPYVGFLIQEMLYNKSYSYKNELQIETSVGSFRSDVGKTTGPLEPHEFWYFWRQHFQFPDIPVSQEEFLKTANFKTFVQQVSKVQKLYNRPFFLKSLIMNWYISAFHKHLPNAIFLYIKRDTLDNMQSLLDVRKRYLGDEELWFSFKPKEYSRIASADKYKQVAGQVILTNREIEQQLANVPFGNKIEIEYEKFCQNPEYAYHELRDKVGKTGVEMPYTCPAKKDFSSSMPIKKHGFKLVSARQHVLETFQ